MPHRDTIVDGNSVELGGIATHLLDFLADYLAYLVQMGMTRHKLGKRIDDGNNGLAKLLMLHARGHPQGTCSRHAAAFCAHGTT